VHETWRYHGRDVLHLLPVLVGLMALVAPSVAGLWLLRMLARRLRHAPTFVVLGAWWLRVVITLLVGVCALTWVIDAAKLSSGSDGTTEKARSLAEGVSTMMDAQALALLVFVVALGWTLFWTWKLHERSR